MTTRLATRSMQSGGASLRSLRKARGKTQQEVAHMLETNQGEVSRIEHRRDWMVSTIQRYAKALGARCEIAFVFRGGRRIRVVFP
jgi:transcriptional regulator with XRE-family HTH domain